jgi:Domain of unknown function (DUF6457)
MTAEEWIRAFSDEIGAQAPSQDEMNEILRLAGIAAHASERIAAPIACYLVGTSGRSLSDALTVAEGLAERS